jgi:hypothetical protein
MPSVIRGLDRFYIYHIFYVYCTSKEFLRQTMRIDHIKIYSRNYVTVHKQDQTEHGYESLKPKILGINNLQSFTSK